MTRRPTVYGLDIETDTRTNAIDPQVARVRAAALSCDGSDEVFEGEEEDLIAELDDRLASLPPGILATWNGAAFDLPFLADRAAVCGVPIGLRLRYDPRLGARRAALPGHPGAYRAAWYRHGHIDAYRVYRGDAAASPRLPGGLRCLARLAGLRVVEVDRDVSTELVREAAHAYAAGDARLARVLTERRWPGAKSHLDRRVPDAGPWVPPWRQPEPQVEVEIPAFAAVAAGGRDEVFVLAGPSWGGRNAGEGDDVERVVIRADRAVGDGDDAGGQVADDDGTAVPDGVAQEGGPSEGAEPAEGDVAAWATSDGDGPEMLAPPHGGDAEPAEVAAVDAGEPAVATADQHAPAVATADQDEPVATTTGEDDDATTVAGGGLPAGTPSTHDDDELTEPAATDDGPALLPAAATAAAASDALDATARPAAAPAEDATPRRDAPGLEADDAGWAVPTPMPVDGAGAAAAAAEETVVRAEAVPVAGPDGTAGAVDEPEGPVRGAAAEVAALDLTTVDVRPGSGAREPEPRSATLFDQDAPEPAPEAEVA